MQLDNPRCQKDRELNSASTNLHTARSMLRAFCTCFMEFAPRGVGVALVIWNCLDNPYMLYCRCCRVPQYIRSYIVRCKVLSPGNCVKSLLHSSSILFSCATPTHDLQRSCSSLCICHTLHKIHAQFDLWNVIESDFMGPGASACSFSLWRIVNRFKISFFRIQPRVHPILDLGSKGQIG